MLLIPPAAMTHSSTTTLLEPPQVTASRTTSIAYQNPAIPGFAPDPSVVQVGGVFFLVTSSFHVFPGIPIYVSHDLNSWIHLGNAINRHEQLDLSKATTHAFDLDTGHKMVASGGLWAPTIRHHKGRFYIICTNCCEGGEAHFIYKNFYIWTDDIYSNVWSDPIFLDFHGIDPSLFFDDDGKVYFQGAWELTRKSQPSCTIMQMEIDIATGKPLTPLRVIWGGHAQYDTEGPHIYKKDGYYYLLVAEGGTFENHMLSIGRSKSIWGPYESCPSNPILTARGTKEYIQNTGHGELFQDTKGSWWAAVLAVRDEAGDRCPMGRETFLTPVKWPIGGWPSLAQPCTYFRREGCIRPQDIEEMQRVEGIGKMSRAQDVYIRSPCLTDYEFTDTGGMSMKPRTTTLSSTSGIVSFLGRRQRLIDCIATARLLIAPTSSDANVTAGLVVYKDDQRHIGLYYDYKANRVFVRETMKHMDHNIIVHSTDLASRPHTIQFWIQSSSEVYQMRYQVDQNPTVRVNHTTDTAMMTARDFTGTLYGLTASTTDGEDGPNVYFQDFDICATNPSQRYISNMLINARRPNHTETDLER